ncbi:hypothetical protein ACFZAM_02900 [Streptomyces sp. NPDC008079]|uniref:hypothetical protein n=1 Tax=Streptomyces sp. NPDC008079 TaxID=3364806 RepID=UPI0036E63F4E
MGLVVTAARLRLQVAVREAQAALVEVVDAAAEFDALRTADAEGGWEVDGGVLLAWLAYRVAVARYGPGHRLVGHLRYFAGQRFVDERPDGLFAGVARPGEQSPTRPP